MTFLGIRKFGFGFYLPLLVFGTPLPLLAEAHLRDDVVMVWAMNARPLAEYAQLGMGLLGPDDAEDTRYCPWQWDPQLPAVSGTELCKRVIAIRKNIGTTE